MKNVQMSSDWLRVALLLSEISRSMACLVLYGKLILIVNSHVYRYSQQTVKMQTILCSKWFVKVLFQCNVSLYSVLLGFALINIHIFNHSDPRLSRPFRVIPTSPDCRGSTVVFVEISGKAKNCWVLAQSPSSLLPPILAGYIGNLASHFRLQKNNILSDWRGQFWKSSVCCRTDRQRL